MFLHVWNRNRKVIFLVGAIATGGYVSYCVYTSGYFSRKRKQISGFVEGFSHLCEAFRDGADSAALVCRDLKAFLLSDEDDIPQSLKQTFQIMRSREFELAIASLSQGIFRGISEHLHTWEREQKISIFNNRNKSVTDRVMWVDHDYRTSTGDFEKGNGFLRKNGYSFSEWLGNRKVSDYETHNGVKPFGDFRESWEDFIERFMGKLFSERGKSFASAVVGSVARNLTASILEGMRMSNNVEQKDNLRIDCTLEQQNSEKRPPMENSNSSVTLEKIINFSSDRKVKTLIAECIEVFVATAVSVYLEKTKDMNVYEDLVAGLTKTSHQAQVKDLLTCICSGAVDTLVRTSHEVLSQRAEYEHRIPVHHRKEQATDSGKVILQMDIDNMDAEEGIPVRWCQSTELGQKQNDDPIMESVTAMRASLDDMLDSQEASASISPLISYNSNRGNTKDICFPLLKESRSTGACQPEDRSLSFIDGLSKALAVPNIRKLVIEVAGAITSQAVQSFFDVILTFFKPVSEGHDREHRYAGALSLLTRPSFKTDKVMHITRIIAANSLVAMTLWLAVVMHVLSGVMEGSRGNYEELGVP